MNPVYFSRSIDAKRLVFKKTFCYMFDLITDSLSDLSFVFMPLLVLMISIQNSLSIYNYTSLFGLLFLIWSLIGLYYRNKLIVIRKINSEKDKMALTEILRDAFPDLEIKNSRKKIVRYEKHMSPWKWGKSLTILYNDSDAYINLQLLARHDTKFAFLGIFSYLRIVKVRRKFYSMIS
jgi:hypothetical protein